MYNSLKKILSSNATLKIFLLIFLIGITVYGNGLLNGFVGDDFPQIVDNTTRLTIQDIPSFFLESVRFTGSKFSVLGTSYKPLFTTSYALIYSLFGLNPFAFHAFQISIVILNSFLVYLLLKTVFKKEIAILLSLIFLLHPINSENAFYLASTQEVLYFLFGMAGFLILQKARSKKGILLTFFFLLISLLAKETGGLFLAVTLIYVVLIKRKFRLLCFISSTLLIFGYTALKMNASHTLAHTSILTPIQQAEISIRLLNIPYILFFYLKTFIFPKDLSMSYLWVYRNASFESLFVPVITILVFFLGMYFVTRRIWKNERLLRLFIFFFIWFTAGLILHLHILPLDGTVAERWFYFPVVGLLGMAGVALTFFKVKLQNTWVLLLILLLLGFLAARTFIRSFDWRDDLSIATHDLKVSKEAYNLEDELTFYYFSKKDYQLVKIHAQNSIKIHPGMVAYNSLGVANFYLGNFKEAMEDYKKSISLGDYKLSFINLSTLYLVYGDKKEGMEFIKKALKIYPHNAALLLNLAKLEYKYGNKDDAKTYISQAYSYDKSLQVKIMYNKIMKQ